MGNGISCQCCNEIYPKDVQNYTLWKSNNRTSNKSNKRTENEYEHAEIKEKLDKKDVKEDYIKTENECNNEKSSDEKCKKNDNNEPIKESKRQKSYKEKNNVTISDNVDKTKPKTTSISLHKTDLRIAMWKLRLNTFEVYNEKIDMSQRDYNNSLEVYNRLGQYNYGLTEFPDGLDEKIATNFDGNCLYYGQFKPGTEIFEGVGICVWKNGPIYEGNWRNGNMNGLGRHIYFNGSYYIGDHKNGMRDGQGESHYDNGDVYIGQFLNGDKHGRGVLTKSDGTKQEGLWVNNEFIG